MTDDQPQPFRLGVVGAGRMGMTHVHALATSPAIALVGVVDPSAEALEAAAAAGYPVHTDIERLLDAVEVDGMLIAAPTDLHVELVSRVVSTGIPVLCEKPCGLSIEEVEECARAADDAGVVLRVAYWRRFVPELRELRQQILSGALGEILAVNCYQWDKLPPPVEFRDRSGGIFVDMGVHEFDQIRWLTGQEFATLHAAVSVFDERGDDPDCGQVVGSLDGGTTAHVSLGRWHPDGDSCKVEVFGSAGTAASWFLRPSDGDEVFADVLRRQAEDFAATVLGPPASTLDGRDAGATVADAVAALRLAELAAERAAKPTPL